MGSTGSQQHLGPAAIQMGLFYEQNLFELGHPDFPGERLVERDYELLETIEPQADPRIRSFSMR